MKHKTISRSIQMIIIAALLYAVFIIFSNIDQTVELIAKFPILIFMTMVVFALINYLIRYLKWEYYLRAIGVHVPCSTSILCFLSGFSMTLTPAKSGELIKPWLLTRFGYESVHTAPVVVLERITDLFGMIFLLVASAALLGAGIIPALTLLAILLLLIIIAQTPQCTDRILRWMSRFPRLERFLPMFDRLIQSTRVLSGPGPIVVGSLFSVISWFFECLCLYLAMMGLGVPISIPSSVFIFATSTLAGLLILIPGGLGATEGVMTALISAKGIPLDVAVSATLLTRVATLWFAVGVGMVALFIFNMKYRVIQPYVD